MNVINTYVKKTGDRQLLFLHTQTGDSTTRFLRDGHFYGVIMDEYFHTSECSFNPKHLVSKGWKKVDTEPVGLKVQMLNDISVLGDKLRDGDTEIEILEVLGMLKSYAKLIEAEELVYVCSGSRLSR